MNIIGSFQICEDAQISFIFLQAIWPYSGHYHPTEENFQEFISFLKEHLVDLSNVKVEVQIILCFKMCLCSASTATIFFTKQLANRW